MEYFYKLVIIFQVLSALAIIVLVLMQHGKGADMGAAFGSGASGSLFGASGSSNFMSKSTAIAAAIFFGCTLAIAKMSGPGDASGGTGLLERAPVPATPAPASSVPAAPANTVPAAPAPAPAAPAPANEIPK
jgi:preprotein translocase subunit SecG